jgi:hypothetical protein
MHHGDDLVLGEDARELCLVDEIADHEGAADEATVSRRKVVVDNGSIAGRFECAAGMRADIAGASGDQDRRLVGHRLRVRLVSDCRLRLNRR